MHLVNDFTVGAEKWRFRVYFQVTMLSVSFRERKYTSDTFSCGYDLRRKRRDPWRPRVWIHLDA